MLYVSKKSNKKCYKNVTKMQQKCNKSLKTLRVMYYNIYYSFFYYWKNKINIVKYKKQRRSDK